MNWRTLHSLLFGCTKALVIILISILTFSDSWFIFVSQHKIELPKANADSGDLSIFRNSSDITSLTTTPLDVTWNTVVTENSNITLQGNNSSIDLASAGKYLVMYNVWASDNAGVERRNIETYLTLDGTALPYGRGSGYIRDSGGDTDSYNSGAAIIDVTTGQDLEVVAVRNDTEASQVDIRAGKNGVSVLKMKDDLDYLRIYKDTDTTGVDANTVFTDVTWGASDEIDTGSFSFTDGAGNITLKGTDGSHFLITLNVRLEQTAGSSNRLNFESRLTLDGVEIPATRVTAYIRGNPNSDGVYFGTLAYSGIIQKTSASDQILNIEMRKESIGSTAATKIVANESAVSIVALPDNGDYISLTSTTSSQALTTTRVAFDWNEQLEVDTTAFSHSTTTNSSRINFNLNGDYIFFSTAYATRTTNGTRSTPVIEWNLDGFGSPLTYGGHGSFNRGDQGTNDAFTSGSSGGVILNGITDTQYLEIMRIDESASTNNVFNPWSIGVQGVEISKLFVADVDISATSSHSIETDIPTAEFYSGGGFVIQPNNGIRNVINITITESGTIDAQNGLDNIELWYDLDTTAPYDCASESYSGVGETQFGSTDTNGFSGINGVSNFTGSVQITATKSMCLYTVYDVTDNSKDGETVKISLNNPSADVVISGNPSINTSSTLSPANSTMLRNAELTQIHYNWRNDDGSEITATSIEGAEDMPAIGFSNGTTRRLRMEISAEGSTSSPVTQYRLEYAQKITTCDAAGIWTDVGTGGGGDWDMVNTINLTDGNNTTNISTTSGGVTDENITFLTPNGGQKDTSSQTGNIALTSTEFLELEYAIEPTIGAPQGNTYCFRLSDSGTALRNYNIYPEGTISADIDVSSRGSQVSTLDISSINNYLGGGFVIERPGSTRTITDITITESGTIDAQNGLDNIELWYDLDTTAPYDCASESYSGVGETQFGSTDTNGFSGINGTSTFSSSEIIDNTRSMCVYVILDTTANTANGETINIEISDPSIDVIVTSSSVGPSTSISPVGDTTIAGSVLTQTHYQWRNDDGNETDGVGGATSATNGLENVALVDVPQNSTRRVRLQVSNEGTVSSLATQYRLEYGTKITECSAIGVWTDVGATLGAFDMVNTINLTDGNNTTNISTTSGGVTDENITFLTPNGGQKDTSSQTGNIALTSTEFLELEYAIEATDASGYGTTYCFRVSDAGSELSAYTNYPELRTREKKDFFIQRGVTTITGTSSIIMAGIDYVAPAASTSAFIRITNSQITGAGENVDNDSNKNANGVTAYFENPENIESSITLARPSDVSNSIDTRVNWEIIEYVGLPGADNEMKIRHQGTVTYGTTALFATGTVLANISDGTDIVVYITGQYNPDGTTADWNTGLSIASWNTVNDTPVFERGEAGGDAVRTSYAVVEFTGANWIVQRIPHNYAAAGITETEAITAINSISKTFTHSQKMVGVNEAGLDEMGHQVWISSVGAISYRLQADVTAPALHTSVAWIVENIQTGDGAAKVTQLSGRLSSGACGIVEPCTEIISLGETVDKTSNTSVSITNSSTGAGTAFPRPIVALRLVSTTDLEAWRSDSGQNEDYRIEVVEWPTAELTIRQNYYRLYVDNDSIDPTDPWPIGVNDLGENASMTVFDDPISEGEVIRIRMTASISNATLPELTASFKLQYGRQDSTCAAIGSWVDVGGIDSGSIWRGYNGSPTDGTEIATSTPAPGTLNISLSDVAGTYEEENNSAINPYAVFVGEDIEYDWVVQHNGASQKTDYCFRMTESDSTPLDGYLNYPTVRTTGYSPITANWRWYDDATNTTPILPMATENTAPIDVSNENEIKLRISIHEIENASGSNVNFGIQYSQYANFLDGGKWVTSTSTCTATSTWCYADGGGIDGSLIDSAVLSDSDSCIGGSGNGCGQYNEGTTTPSILTHNALTNMEFEFTLKQAGARVNTVYYFRAYDIANDEFVSASSTYPSLVTEGASLSFSMEGLASSTDMGGGVILDIDSTPATLNFGSIPVSTYWEGAHRLTINTNGTEGYRILMAMNSDLQSSFGAKILPITSTNASPTAWLTGCNSDAASCFGYHTSDATLEGGSTRFSATDTYAQVSTTTLDEVSYSSQPASTDSTDVIFRIFRRELQDAGLYEARMIYISVPIF